jgi:hypothetical protein
MAASAESLHANSRFLGALFALRAAASARNDNALEWQANLPLSIDLLVPINCHQ